MRVGSRNDWHHESRWIDQTYVNADQPHQPDPGLRVYKLPPPPPATPTPAHPETDRHPTPPAASQPQPYRSGLELD